MPCDRAIALVYSVFSDFYFSLCLCVSVVNRIRRMHIHILGICGTFMGGIAAIARQAGHHVTGCDANVYPPMSTQLEALGIDLIEGWDPQQTELGPDLFVIGNVVSRGNPLMEAILNRGLPYVSGPQWLAEHVLPGKWTLAVAGTHGKTTTASMLAWILEDAGLEPGFLIGGVPVNFGASARASASHFFVIEADEYDTAFFDKRSKFVHYRPRTAVLNNLEFDHADIFADLAAIETQFHHLLRTIPGNGLVVANGREQSLQRVIDRGCWTPVEWLGRDAGWRAGAPAADGSFEVLLAGEPQGRVHWDLLGEHNRMNALAALAAARHAGVPLAQGIAALGGFRNVRRRMEVLGTVAGVTVYDDFAHHPTAIGTTIAGLRQKVGAARILAVLEPRSNTMKLGAMKSALPDSLAAADQVFCYTDGLQWDAAQVLGPLGKRAECHGDLDALVQAVARASRAGDHVLIMSNGGFGGIHARLLDAIGRRM
jgi:UDP-N-acetylmuramate: L-alanyl-gamma-D-glutamyl-meso-diaminopimelate ligase